MKIKGSVEFDDVEEIKENLEKIIKQEGRCHGIGCSRCIFNTTYAKDGKECENNTIFLLKNSNCSNFEMTKRAKEILAEIEEGNKK